MQLLTAISVHIVFMITVKGDYDMDQMPRKPLHLQGLSDMYSYTVPASSGCSMVGPLGMISGGIEDSQITASSTGLSSWRENCRTSQARLYLKNGLSWCAKFKSLSEWLQVDLGTEALITGVMTQGRADDLEWVSSFMISFSSDGTNFLYVKDTYGGQKVFEGNVDSFTVKHNYFDEPLMARFIKFHTYTWHSHPSMRVEILGCQPCKQPLGVFPYGRLTSSGSKGKKQQRSCVEEFGHMFSNKGWCSKIQNVHQWLQLDIGPPSLVTALVTKGRGDGNRNHWVTHYQISYSNNSKTWYYYKQNLDSGPRKALSLMEVENLRNGSVFEGNRDKDTVRIQYLQEPFIARFIRFHPVNWLGKIAMRIGVLGCIKQGDCGQGYFRINEHSPCIANLAYRKLAWITTDSKMRKRRVSGFWNVVRPTKQALKAVDGRTKWELSRDDQQDGTNVPIDIRVIRKRHRETCTELYYKYPYSDSPTWSVNLGEQTTVNGVVIYNGYDVLFRDDSDVDPSEREQVERVQKIAVYIEKSDPMLGYQKSQLLCGYLTNINKALIKPKIHISCRKPIVGQFVYIQALTIDKQRRDDYKAILCEVMIY